MRRGDGGEEGSYALGVELGYGVTIGRWTLATAANGAVFIIMGPPYARELSISS